MKSIRALQLKRGAVISCGPVSNEFGDVHFLITGTRNAQKDFATGLEKLHSFEYDEAEKVFARIISQSPNCAMAYWGVAMCNFHPLWDPPSESDLNKGSRALAIAHDVTKKSARETDYIKAAQAYYSNWKSTDPLTRIQRFMVAMEELHKKYPNDPEAGIFYALALDAAADPTDKTYSNQKKAGAILEAFYKNEPTHPGIVHYLIHTYDYPGIAAMALPAARRYAAVAPSSAHALHMPSHIFTRLGLWNEAIRSNLESIEAAKCYAASAGFKGHWDEELHGLDYLVYAYLQKGDNVSAARQLQYLSKIRQVYPINFKEAYTFAASPARMVLENKNWPAAAKLPLQPSDFPWERFLWQEAIIHFTRLLGAAHMKNFASATNELSLLKTLFHKLEGKQDFYKSGQVAIQIQAGEAWIDFLEGRKTDGLKKMQVAVEMEDSTSKHPVTPGEVLPARELYADMLLQSAQFQKALGEYEKVLQKSPNRFNSVYGAGNVAAHIGQREKALVCFYRLADFADPSSDRPELARALAYIKK